MDYFDSSSLVVVFTYTSLLGSKSESISPTIFEGSFLYWNGALLFLFESNDFLVSWFSSVGDSSTDSTVIMLLSGMEVSSGFPNGCSSLPLLSSSLVLSVYYGANRLACRIWKLSFWIWAFKWLSTRAIPASFLTFWSTPYIISVRSSCSCNLSYASF